MKNKAFKAYDIRGIYNKDFTKEDVYKIGFFLSKQLNAKKVLIGRDIRNSSNEIFTFLANGIVDSGADVYDCGLATTPMIYYTTAMHNFPASVMITASHNSKDYNGLKISRSRALPVGYETGLADLEQMMQTMAVAKVDFPGKIIPYDAKQPYIEYLKPYIPDISNLKVAIDCSNGMAGLVIEDVLGEHPHYLYNSLNGDFPNHDPNPLVEENVQDLKKYVVDNACDVGVIYDGDADRVMFVDETGKFISPDLMIAVLARFFLSKEKGPVLHDIRTSKSVTEYIEKLGGKVHIWKVGHAFAKIKLREINGIFGGELAGHYYFRDFYYCDSGILASLIILGVIAELKKQDRTISALINKIEKYAFSGEINFKIERKEEAMEVLRLHFAASEKLLKFYDFDGYRMEFENWWFNVRPSNTEPYLRLVVEARDNAMLKKKIEEIKSIIKNFE